MARFIKNRKALIDKGPGNVTFIGRQKMDKPRFRLLSYNLSEVIEHETDNAHDLVAKLSDKHVNWINIDGLHNPDVINEVGRSFELSPLVLEDIANTDQRPKMVEDNHNIVVFMKQVQLSADTQNVQSEQITLVLGNNYVISFQEQVGTFFEPIRQRLRDNIGKLRSLKADYLFYRIIDTVVDNYMVCLGSLGELIEGNEEHILSKNNKELIEEIYHHKTEISFVRKAVRPAREISKQLKNSESGLLTPKTRPFFDDIDDLVTHAIETIDVYYTMISDQLNIYNTNLSNSANEVMKVLTIFAAIFIPLTFIAGIYGTNFDYVPELHFKYGYFMMWGVMLLMAIAMLLFFKKKKWL
ncbi:MAG: magnesium/cobalt transporter CorA [Prolixibacteraceae bacterium]|nr:magnesium/cobalt transporter CorA [Prolixibacteraceae bacterium]MBN2650279.1 magnesium/cobalt transporter CorA [Prolixibacteraceae bacterium]